ncbi:MAG: DUF4157 domain-containing protein [Bacteroidota bacterium]
MNFKWRPKRPSRKKKQEQKEADFFTLPAKSRSHHSGTTLQPKLKFGKAGDQYEQEADRVARQVVAKGRPSKTAPKAEAMNIQRVPISTPLEDEKLGTAEQKNEKDRLIQEQPELQAMEEEEEVQMMEVEEEVQMMEEEEEVQMMEEEEEVQMMEEEEEVQMMEEEEEVQMMEEEEEVQMMEEEEEVQMMEEEEEVQMMEEEEEVQMMEEEEEIQMMEEEEEAVQAGGPASSQASPEFQKTLQAQKGLGFPLPDPLRQELEAEFSADFSGVRIHTDQAAAGLCQDIHAQAFAHGRDIFFNAGKYQPHTAAGKLLLAHELTHTIQQGASPKTTQAAENPDQE